MSLRLLLFTQYLIYPWLYSEPKLADVTKGPESSHDVKSWDTMAQWKQTFWIYQR